MSSILNPLHLLRKPDAATLALRELEDAERNLLEAERMQQYYTHLSAFYQQRIEQLSKTHTKQDLTAHPFVFSSGHRT